MIHLRTEIEIAAPRDLVWDILTDFPAYSSWNPYIPAISGELRAGSTLSVHAQPSGTFGRTFHPEVLHVDPPSEFRWVGRLPIPGLFNGEHIFRLEALGEARVRFVHREEFSGPWTLAHRLFRYAAAKRGFCEMNEALKRHAERDTPGAETAVP